MKLSNVSLALAAAIPTASAFAFVGGGGAAALSAAPSRDATALFGILDEIEGDSYDLLGGGSASEADNKQSSARDDAYEVFLGQLVFSPNDPRVDIVENWDLATDEDFVGWLNKKVSTSTDPEEKLALRDLHGMIIDVKRKVELNAMAEERIAKEAEEAEQARANAIDIEAEEGRALTDTDLLRKAAAVDRSGIDRELSDQRDEAAAKKTFYDSEITPEIRLSYEELLGQILPPYNPGETPASVAFTFYDKFDAQFVKVLTERSNNGDADAQAILGALAEEQSKRIAAATETLKAVLAMGDPMRMEGAIVKMAREGKIDEAFLLLLEANADQADAAGATGPAQLMRKLQKRAMEEKDKQSSTKEVKLLRQLLREDDPAKREELLEEAFTPKDALIVPGTMENAQRAADGDTPEEEKPQPEVAPPDFISACKAVLLNFGNLSNDSDDRGDLSTRVRQIATEAEAVATKIYGQGMSPREQQDRMWEDETTSIFDLERMEMEAEQMGEEAPWANPDNDDIIPGFDTDGVMKIGG